MGKTGLRSLDEKIHNASIALTNASAPEIAPMLAAFGFDEQRINVGREQIIALQATIANQAKEYGEQYQATKEVEDLWTQADKQFGKTRKIAFIAFRGNLKAEHALSLFGRRRRSMSGFLHQATMFYTNLKGEYAQALEAFGYTPEKISEELALLTALQEAVAHQSQEMGEAQMATRSRDAEMENAFAWMSDFYAVAKVALEESPEAREKLGMLERKK